MGIRNRSRGLASPDAGLSYMQRKILAWLLKQEASILESNDANRIKELTQKGIPWSAKRFYDDEYEQSMPREKSSAISASLRRLESSPSKVDPRNLIVRYDAAGGLGKKQRTSHVKLTQTGRATAEFELEHGQTKRRLSDSSVRNPMELDARQTIREMRAFKRGMKEAESLSKRTRQPSYAEHPFLTSNENPCYVSTDHPSFELLYRQVVAEIRMIASRWDLPISADEADTLPPDTPRDLFERTQRMLDLYYLKIAETEKEKDKGVPLKDASQATIMATIHKMTRHAGFLHPTFSEIPPRILNNKEVPSFDDSEVEWRVIEVKYKGEGFEN